MYKFRAWDKGNKCYISEWQDATRLIENHGFNGGDYFVVEQCTGKKDKNGKSIYFNDIARWVNGSTNELDTEKVEWDCDYAGFGLSNMHCLDFSQNIEIIGTVNENSELLNEPKGNDNGSDKGDEPKS